MQYHKQKIIRFAVLLFTAFILFSCTSYRYRQTPIMDKHYNISYGENKRHRFDLFIPEDSTLKNDIVFIVHGGAWVLGEKSHLRSIQNALSKAGYTTVNLTYRLASKSKKINYKNQLEDIDTAIRYFLENTKNYDLKPKQLVILGESAGAHLSLLYGYSHPDLIDKIISFSGPTDFYSKDYQNTKFYHWYTKSTFSIAAGDEYKWKDSIPDTFKEASPIAHVSHVPTLLFQGNLDILVNPQQAYTLAHILEKENIPHKLVKIKGAGHLPRFNPWLKNNVIIPEVINFINNDSLK